MPGVALGAGDTVGDPSKIPALRVQMGRPSPTAQISLPPDLTPLLSSLAHNSGLLALGGPG